MAGLLLSVLCLLLAGGVLLVHRPQDAVLPGGGPGHSATAAGERSDARGYAAAALLDQLVVRLERGTRRQVVGLAAPGDARAARELTTLRDNVRALGVTDLAMRYVTEDAAQPGQTAQPGPGAWVGDVQLRWRLRGFDTQPNTMEVPITFRDEGARASFVTARRLTGTAVPLWLLTRVSVSRTARSLVASASSRAVHRFSRLADQAVVDVRKVLTRWRGRLVVEVPADQTQLNQVLGSEPGAYSEIAAVTTTADRSRSAGDPVHIFVNPRVFDPLGVHGSQIVMSHEATHVATGAALSSMPTWLLEGFADYVALDHVRLPVSVTASQILTQVRRKGPPSHLPGPAEFNAQNVRLGATYESAWLACRLLGERYGERRLLAFYRAADRASSTTGPFRTVLGTDQRELTRAWRADLRRLAGSG